MNMMWTNMIGVCILITWLCFLETHGYEAPTVTLSSCMHETATVTIENAWDGGIIYFRTDTAYNMIASYNGTIVHECVFEECNIEWDEKFYIVVQRSVLYQTSHDVIVWLTCNTNFGALSTLDFSLTEMLDDNLTTTVYKPEVSMSLLVGGVPLENQDEVKLGTEITMVVQITNDPGGYFDIGPKSCYASGITLYEDSCPASEDLLGQFNTSVVGYTSVTFGMFRPTSIVGGAVEVVFTCILEVCDAVCEEPDCTNRTTNNTNPVRRRRDVRKNSNPSVIRGFTLKVFTEGDENVIQDTQPTERVCLAMYAVVALIGTFFLVLFMAITVTGYNFQRSLLMKGEIDAHKLRQNVTQIVDKGLGDLVNDKDIYQTGSKSLDKFKQPNKRVDKMAFKKATGIPDMTYTPTVSNNDSLIRDRSNSWSEARGVSTDTGLSSLTRYSQSTYRRKSVCKTSE